MHLFISRRYTCNPNLSVDLSAQSLARIVHRSLSRFIQWRMRGMPERRPPSFSPITPKTLSRIPDLGSIGRANRICPRLYTCISQKIGTKSRKSVFSPSDLKTLPKASASSDRKNEIAPGAKMENPWTRRGYRSSTSNLQVGFLSLWDTFTVIIIIGFINDNLHQLR